MKPRQHYLLICLPVVLLNMYAVFTNISWLDDLSEVLIFVTLFFAFFRKLDTKNLNFIAFLILSLTAIFMTFSGTGTSMYLFSILVHLISYSFLIREALKFTRREAANRFMLIFFSLLVLGNVYFVFEHLMEMRGHMAGVLDFSLYSLYYLNLLVLAIVALIYYLNSYSKKSVYFITLIMALILSDILRDMVLFYMPDTSILLLQNFLKVSAVILAFLFFTTEEKKLRLRNLV